MPGKPHDARMTLPYVFMTFFWGVVTYRIGISKKIEGKSFNYFASGFFMLGRPACNDALRSDTPRHTSQITSTPVRWLHFATSCTQNGILLFNYILQRMHPSGTNRKLPKWYTSTGQYRRQHEWLRHLPIVCNLR